MSKPLNVLWIMADQYQAACLGCMGNPAIQTPNLDRLAAEGVCFENAFCQSPVCMASRASVMTGRYPSSVRVRGMGVLPPSEVTLAERLAREGYATGAFGKLHLTPERYARHNLGSDVPILDWHAFAEDARLSPVPDDPYKVDYGFQTHVGCDDACQGNFQAWLRTRAPDLADATRPDAPPDGPHDLFVSPYPSDYHQTTYIAGETETFIRAQTGVQPWFAFCSFIAPHHPFEAPADQIARYPLDSIPLPEVKGGVDIGPIPTHLSEAIGEMDRYPESIQRRIVQHYYASISLIDDAVGRLLDAVETMDQRENTVVIFVADHGEMLGAHGLLRKPSFHYDELLRVPLIIRAPGGSRGSESGLVELVDLYPTLLGLLDLAIHPGVQGIDWSGALRDGNPIGRPDIYSEMHRMDPMVYETGSGPYTACRTLRTADWKLNVYPCDDLACSQLFQLAEDPDESTNRFHDPACRDQRETLLWRLIERINADADPLPLRLRQW